MATPQKPTSYTGETRLANGSAITLFASLASIVLFFGGFILLSRSFSTPGAEALMFGGGIIASTIGLMIPLHVLRWFDGA